MDDMNSQERSNSNANSKSNVPDFENDLHDPTDSKWLILVPTTFELNILAKELTSDQLDRIEICGFGAIVPAARTAELIQRQRPDRVLLLGIAGAYENESEARSGRSTNTASLEVGQAISFSQVACYGVGVGTGEEFQTAGQMGWQHWPGESGGEAIGDQLELEQLRTGTDRTPADCTLLTVSSASNSSAEVNEKLRRFPQAVAEDMEGFAVAAACHLSKTPLTIIRGLSNIAGDRNKANWKIKEALSAAANMAKPILQANP
jgi:futalosine hydrolase